MHFIQPQLSIQALGISMDKAALGGARLPWILSCILTFHCCTQLICMLSWPRAVLPINWTYLSFLAVCTRYPAADLLCEQTVWLVQLATAICSCCAAASSAAESTPTPVNVGQQTVSTTVTITYAIC